MTSPRYRRSQRSRASSARASRRRPRARALLGAALVGLALVGVAGCGGGGAPPGSRADRFDGPAAWSLLQRQVAGRQRPAGSPQLRQLATELRPLLPGG